MSPLDKIKINTFVFAKTFIDQSVLLACNLRSASFVPLYTDLDTPTDAFNAQHLNNFF